MKVSVSVGTAAKAEVDAVAFLVFDGETERSGPALKEADRLAGARCDRLFAAAGFRAEAEKVLVHHRAADGPKGSLQDAGCHPAPSLSMG